MVQRLVLFARRAAAAMTQPGVQLRQRARVQTRTHQTQHRLAVMTNDLRLQDRRLIDAIQPPVLLELPDEKAGQTGQKEDRRRRHSAAQRRAQQRFHAAS